MKGEIERYNFEYLKNFIGNITISLDSNIELEFLPEHSLATTFFPSNQYWFKEFVVPAEKKWLKKDLNFKLSIYL